MEDGPASTSREALAGRHATAWLPPEMEVAVRCESDVLNPGGIRLKRCTTWSGAWPRSRGAIFATPGPSLDEFNQPAVSFSLNRDGSRESSAMSPGRTSGATWRSFWMAACRPLRRFKAALRMKVGSAGSFTQQEAADLALKLQVRGVAGIAHVPGGANRRAHARRGLDPGWGGGVGIRAHRGRACSCWCTTSWLAINAIVAVAMNLLILMGFMAYVGAVLTLPGIAGLILTIGIGVDSNVLIFERIKEELRSEKGVTSRGCRGVRPRVPGPSWTHTSRRSSAAGFLVSVWFGTDPRVCDHAGHRADRRTSLRPSSFRERFSR